ncbi:MAG: hypothetical protein Q9190_007791, partial [Brigantiaea leucoxantha]
MAPSAISTTPPPPSSKDDDVPIPLIHLPPLLTPRPTPETLKTSRAILDAFRSAGFLYFDSISSIVSPQSLSHIFSLSASFFALPQATKDKLSWTTPKANRGYSCIGREKVCQDATTESVAKARQEKGNDLKESFEIGREGQEGCPNNWPTTIQSAAEKKEQEESEHEVLWDQATEFRESMQSFFLICKELHKLVMRAIALGMGLEETFFDPFVKQGDNTLRLLHYPALPRGGFGQGDQKRERAGVHTDFGSVTFLFQDSRGGLQVEKLGKKGEWTDVEPREGT